MSGTTTAAGMTLGVSVHPPESLAKYEAPIFRGVEPTQEDSNFAPSKILHDSSKLEDMINSMIPPR